MKDDLIFLVNGRQPLFRSRQPRQYCFNPTKLNMQDDLNFLKMEDDLIFFEIGKRPAFFENGRQPQFFFNRKQP
jgi:hypothetical protein